MTGRQRYWATVVFMVTWVGGFFLLSYLTR